ncbi:MAG: phage minor capsid protein, partial [Ruthenibacterium lactatiformans]
RENAKGVTYEGRHYTQYEATQQQKALENSIRQCKDRIAAAQEEGKLGSGELRSSRILLRQLNAEYKRFSAAAGLRTAPERLRAAGLGRALKPDGTLEMPRPAGTLTGSGGKLDVEEARKSYSAYLDTLTDAPEKNMVWLRHFTEKSPTGYEEDPTLAAPFAYSAKKDKILYNPNAPGFAEMDFDFANTHENAHRADVMHMRSYRNEGFKRAAQLAGEKILKNMEGYQRVAQNIRSKPLKDVFSALSAGKLYTAFGHSVEYWERNPSFTFTEIFAELFTMETQGDSDLYFVKTLFPELWDEYQKLF